MIFYFFRLTVFDQFSIFINIRIFEIYIVMKNTYE